MTGAFQKKLNRLGITEVKIMLNIHINRSDLNSIV